MIASLAPIAHLQFNGLALFVDVEAVQLQFMTKLYKAKGANDADPEHEQKKAVVKSCLTSSAICLSRVRNLFRKEDDAEAMTSVTEELEKLKAAAEISRIEAEAQAQKI